MRCLIFLFCGIVLLLSGCATTLRSEVTAFHQWVPTENNLSFTFVRRDPSTEHLEKQHYEKLISAELQKLGMHESVDSESAQLLVDFKTSVTPHEIRVFENVMVDFWYGTPWYGPGFYHPYAGWSGYAPYGGWGGWGGAPVVHRQERRFTLFRYELKLTLMNATNQLSVYEATVRSEDRRGNLVKIMPNLLSSIFLNFPGKNGVPVSVESTLK